jgi:quinol monooxygenase YgiN
LRSRLDSNGIGDLPGVAAKLDHVATPVCGRHLARPILWVRRSADILTNRGYFTSSSAWRMIGEAHLGANPTQRAVTHMIDVIAIITAKPGKRAAILQAFHANIPAVHAEEGCIEYGPAIDAEGVGSLQTPFGADTFVVLEKWASLDHLKAHGRSPHMKAYADQTRELIANRVIHVLSPA